tara:strand:- start:91114 stop:92118 length:1005 start_codon:yes stop_codon:yes gene_type:complete
MNRLHCLQPQPETTSGYQFTPADLRVGERDEGISAFMRIRNGADFLELTIRSHIEFFDEIVAVYNDCTDATPDILTRLQLEFGAERLRVIHYTDPVFPPGSEGHARTHPNSPNSLVNYYNFALSATRFTFATKLDDDHLAIAQTTKAVTDSIRSGSAGDATMNCFSGLNLFQRPDQSLGILKRDPISGGGDIGFFRVTPETLFTHDRRFERFQRGGQKRRFAGFLYWHLKYLKSDMGFGNYALQDNPSSRYAKRQAALQKATPETLDLNQLADSRQRGVLDRLKQVVSDKQLLAAQRDEAIATTFPDADVAAAVAQSVSPQHYRSFMSQVCPGP